MTSLPNEMLGAFLQNYSKSKELTLDDGHNGTLLDSRGALETVGVDTYSTVRIFLQVPRRGGGAFQGSSWIFTYREAARASGP